MSAQQLKEKLSLRAQLDKRIFSKTDIPLMVYLCVFIAIGVCWLLRVYNDLFVDFMIELLGAAFTLFIIDVLLVRSKNKRWKIVRDDIDYLISRGINRLRDGLATRVFQFHPDVDLDIVAQRREFLEGLEGLPNHALQARFNEQELFSSESYAYFNERAEDLWSILNMKYSEYLPPVLVSQLITLHISLKDLGSHIRQFRKADRFAEDKEYYQTIATKGMADSLSAVLTLVNILQREGYSESARNLLAHP